jgi:N-acetylmuramoyl-L-alanine amidase
MRVKGGLADITARERFRSPKNRSGAVSYVFAIVIWTLTLSAAIPLRLEAAIITGAAIERQDAVTELRFAVRGRGLGWRLTTHGQQLWIDLRNARLELSRPLIADVTPPVTSVEAIGNFGGTARIVVEVTGRDDYAIAHLPHALVLRVAPAGAVADLAAPLIAHPAYHREPSRAVEDWQAIQPTTTAPRTVADYGLDVASRPEEQSSEQPPATASRDRGIPRPQVASMIPAISVPETAASEARRSQLAAYSYRSPPEPPATWPAASPPSSANRETSALVVIDPGHGGYDPGTVAADGTREKDVALAIALRLAASLKAEGIRAELTRSSDTFLSLAERTAVANQAGADLFVSIHMNSSPNSDASGIETYYLNNTTDRATIRLARMENGVSGGYSVSSSPNLNYILSDMRQQYKANDAVSLAQMIEGETASTVNATTGLQLKPLGAMQGPFYVLVGAMMPAVLVECGFLSNADEADLLETPAYQQAIANGIARAVADYFKTGAAIGNL